MKTTIQFGPQHPVLHEPIHARITLDGEIITDVELEVGFAHRGLEKKFEWDYNKALYLSERVCGICTQHHSTCYSLTVESLMGMDIPRRAQIIRTIMLELERLHSHLLATGCTMDHGFENIPCTAAHREIAGRVRAYIGNDSHGMNVIGGVKRDIDPGLSKEIDAFCDALEKKCRDIEDMVTKSYTIRQRMQGVGVLSEQLAKDLGVVGPIARGSNVPYDLRSVSPYLSYREIKVTPVVERDGDCWARTIVRIRELYQSIDIIRQCLPLLDSAPSDLFTKPVALPDGENFVCVEAPRGELFYYIRGKKSKELDRVKIRTSTYANGLGLIPVIKGMHLSDVGMITMTFDPCIGCFDR
jgi:Ni,Fe-hydrogenase III large subunit